MAFLTSWTVATGRLVSAWRILLLTAGVRLIFQPDWTGDIGFALSFVSTTSIMFFEKRIAKVPRHIPDVIREGLSASLAAQIGVTPILFVTFGRFNIWSPVINALVLWTISYIMIMGSIGEAVGLLHTIPG